MAQKDRAFEEYLVLRARLGDRGALRRLVTLRTPRMLAHAMRLLGHRAEAEDAVQEAWLDICRGLAGLRAPRAFRAWSTRILTRVCARQIDRNVRARSLAADLEPLTERAVLPEETPAGERIQTALAGLPPAQSAALALHYLEEMSVAEVAIALDVPEGTVKTRLMHGRARMKAALKGEDDDQGH